MSRLTCSDSNLNANMSESSLFFTTEFYLYKMRVCVCCAYLPVCSPAWGKFLWWASSLPSHLLPAVLPPPPPPLVSPGCRSPPAPPPSLAPSAGRSDEGSADSLLLLGRSSCRSSHWAAAVFGTASSCARWRGGCRPAGRSSGTGRRSASRGRRGGRAATCGPSWGPKGVKEGRAGGRQGRAGGGVACRKAERHLDAQLPLKKRRKTQEAC